MKYNIFEFNQEKVLSLTYEEKDKTYRLDVNDLLILTTIADIIHRAEFVKYIIDEKTYFSIQYNLLLKDLPILNIGKQALSDRLKKMSLLNVLESKVIKNEFGTFTIFRMGKEYTKLKYDDKEGRGRIEIQGGSYQTTNGVVSNYEPKYSNTNNSNTNNYIKEKDITNVISKKKDENISTAKANTFATRKQEFGKNLISYLDKYPKDMLRDFYNYWSEPNRSQTKMRCEMEKTWDLNLRLSNWAKREKVALKREKEPVSQLQKNMRIAEILQIDPKNIIF